MTSPAAILLDLGDTILREERFDLVLGNARLLEVAEVRAALDRLGREPHEAWYCGNSLEFDVAGARGAS